MIQRPSVYPVAVLFVLLAAAGCAPKQPEQWEQDKSLVLQSIQQTEMDQASLNERVEAMERKIIELEQENTRLEAENRAISSSIESLKRKSARSGSSSGMSQKDKKLATKLEKIGSSIRSAAEVGAPVIKPSDKSIEKNSYTAAYLALKSGRYEEAALGFRTLIQDYPDGEYADQAWYWLGESYFVQRNMKEAIEAFSKIADDYPDSAKHPAALLKLASAYQNVKRNGDAVAVLKRLINEHGDTNAAEQARTQLESVEKGKSK